MSKIHAKNASLMLLVMLILAFAAVPITMASSSLSIYRDPTEGTVPTKVKVWGWCASPCGDVEIWWDADGDSNVLDVLLGVTEAKGSGYYEICVTIPEAFCGAHDLTAWDKASGHSAGTKFTVIPLITLDPYSGPVGTEVTVNGTGFKQNVQMDIYYDGKKIATDPAAVDTNDVGSFTATFIVPESVHGSHHVEAYDRTEEYCYDDDWFCVESKIVLDPPQGPCQTEVTITGTGFNPCSGVHIKLYCCKHDGVLREWIGEWYSNPDDRVPPVTDSKGSFEYTIEIDCTLEGCCPACAGPYKIVVHTQSDGDYACATYIVTPWFTIDPLKGPVGTVVTALGYGFDAESTVDIIFMAIHDIVVAEDVPTDEMGNFVTTFEVPEVVEGCYKISVDGLVLAKKCCGEELCFEVLPWIWIVETEGYVGDTVTVTGKGWDALRHVDVIYAGLAEEPCHPLLFEHVIAPHMALWCVWEKTPICCYNAMIVLQPWGWEIVAEEMTDGNGSFEVSFVVPESTGGYHPIYAGQCVSTMDPYKWSEVVPVFRVHPKIWVEGHEGTSEGLSEMYVTLYGTGFSYYEFWLKLQCYPCRSFSMYLRLGTFVLDFDSNKEWINEFNFILNNEYQEGWQEMYWTWLKWIMGGCTDPSPLLPQGYLPLYIDQSGSLSHGGWWRWLWLQFYHETYPYSDMLVGDSYKGVPSLKVPVLSSGEKELLAYYFGFEFGLTVAPEYAPDMTSIDFVPEGIIEGVPTIMMEPITDPMSLLFGLVPCELGIKLGKIYTETASTTFTINGGSSGDQDILNRLDELDAKITGLVQGAEGNILVKIDTVKGEILAGLADLDAKITAVSDGLATIETKIGTIQTDLTNLGASITAINGRLATIETNIGTIQLDIADINGKLASLDTSGLARIETSVGTILATLGDINTKTTVVGRLATIQTDIETIKGYVEGIDGDVVTIKTDIGTIKGTMSDIKNDTGLQPATIGLSILAAISAIAAAVMILRKVYLK